MRGTDLTVAHIMSTALVVARPDDAIDETDFDMKLAGIRHIPVVDGDNHLVGVVAKTDLLLAFSRADKRPVRIREVMSSPVEAVGPDLPAHEAVALLMERRIGCLPVIDRDDQLIGVITATDFLQVAHQALSGHELTHIARTH